MRKIVGRRTDENCEPKRTQAKRVGQAKETLEAILKDTSHPDYFATDADLHEKLRLSEPVIRKVRASLGVPARDERIYGFLAPMSPESMYLDEMLLKLDGRVSYYCLYQIMRKRGVPFLRRNKG